MCEEEKKFVQKNFDIYFFCDKHIFMAKTNLWLEFLLTKLDFFDKNTFWNLNNLVTQDIFMIKNVTKPICEKKIK